MSAPDDDDEVERIERELDDVLRAYGIASGDLEPEQGDLDDRPPQIIRDILDSPVDSIEPEARRRRPSRAWLIAAAAVVGVLIVGGLLWPFDTGHEVQALTPPLLRIEGIEASDYPLQGSDPDQALERLAVLAETNGVQEIPPDAVHYIETAAWWSETDETPDGPESRLVPVENRTFRDPDGELRLITERGEPLSPDGHVVSGADGPVESDYSLPPNDDFPLGDLSVVSRDPESLRSVVFEDTDECDGMEGFCLINTIQTLAFFHVTDAGLDAAMLRAVVGAQDVNYVGPGRDRIDRLVEVFVLDDPFGHTQRLIFFDAQTGSYAGDETVLIAEDELLEFEPPAVIEFNVVLERRFIDAGEVPPAP